MGVEWVQRCLSMRRQVEKQKEKREKKVYYATSFDHPTLTHTQLFAAARLSARLFFPLAS